ncbi:MAG: hypothetical protein J2P50_10940 [Hyphomicrobiaceae bacterium]|nr:hypothetical protein [Hyphomicrobiaceae bacterium]
MSDTQTTPQAPGGPGLIERWVDFVKGPSGIMAGLMALLALVGTAINLADASWARAYWLALVPVYGILCVIAAWQRTGQFTGTVLHQVLHWLAVGAAIALDYAFLRRGESAQGGGLSSLLILALGSLLAGIHLEWLFGLVGLLLLAIFVFVSLAQQYVTVAFLIAAAGALIFAAYRTLRRR